MATRKNGKATLARLNQILAKGTTSAFALMKALNCPAYVVAKLLLQRIESAPVSRARKVKHG